MPKWEAGIIHPSVNYRTTSGNEAGGMWSLEDQLRHKNATNWPEPFEGWPSNSGQRIAVTLTAQSGGSGDMATAYNVHHEDMDAAVAATGLTGRIYIAVKVNAGTRFQNDFCIGAIQITRDDYSTLEHGWSFNVTADRDDWTQANVDNVGINADGFENYNDIINAGGQSWVAINTAASNGNWSHATSTGSGNTGAADSVADEYSDTSTGTIIGSGTSTIAQAAGTKFIYTESSGNQTYTANKHFWIRSPELTLNAGGDKNFAIAYLAASPNNSSGMQDAADNALIRWWWV